MNEARKDGCGTMGGTGFVVDTLIPSPSRVGMSLVGFTRERG